MKNPLEEITKELANKVHPQIDIFIVQRIIELFEEGVLSLSYFHPICITEEYPYTSLDRDNVTVRTEQKVWLRYTGDELISRLRSRISTLEEELKNYESQDREFRI